MQGIYTHIPETNCVPREYSVAAILLLLFMLLISLVSVLNLLYLYISTFRSTCAVPNIIIIIIIIIIIGINIGIIPDTVSSANELSDARIFTQAIRTFTTFYTSHRH